jgi:hypothetical protein
MLMDEADSLRLVPAEIGMQPCNMNLRPPNILLTATLSIGLSHPAFSDPWRSINQRQAELDQRIEVGIQNKVLTRAEASALRAEFNALALREEDYRHTGGLSTGERLDLDRRFDALRLRIKTQKHDAQVRPQTWRSINDRQAELDARIDQGVRLGTLTRPEAIELRGEFKTLVRLEAEYRRSRGELSAGERADLDRRLEAISARVAVKRGNPRTRY